MNLRNDLSERFPSVIGPLKRFLSFWIFSLSKDIITYHTLSPARECLSHPLFAIIFPLMRMIETSTLRAV